MNRSELNVFHSWRGGGGVKVLAMTVPLFRETVGTFTEWKVQVIGTLILAYCAPFCVLAR